MKIFINVLGILSRFINSDHALLYNKKHRQDYIIYRTLHIWNPDIPDFLVKHSRILYYSRCRVISFKRVTFFHKKNIYFYMRWPDFLDSALFSAQLYIISFNFIICNTLASFVRRVMMYTIWFMHCTVVFWLKWYKTYYDPERKAYNLAFPLQLWSEKKEVAKSGRA